MFLGYKREVGRFVSQTVVVFLVLALVLKNFDWSPWGRRNVSPRISLCGVPYGYPSGHFRWVTVRIVFPSAIPVWLSLWQYVGG